MAVGGIGKVISAGPDLITESGLDDQSKLWRNYVDQLSFVCDFNKGQSSSSSTATNSLTGVLKRLNLP
jgi:hypothetical protein